MWIEMSRNSSRQQNDWGFTKSLWSPTHTTDNRTWAYWELLRQVRAGDIVVHLQGKGHDAEFVGYSSAATDGFETRDRPPEPGRWDFARSFYRVRLENFFEFADPIRLDDVFDVREAELRAYYAQNKRQPRPDLIFFVVQSGRLQCQNGAYLSTFNYQLSDLMLGTTLTGERPPRRAVPLSARTGEQIVQLTRRLGQRTFSDQVRANYGGRCCFPGCSVEERDFLVGAHIVRWADDAATRGETANGLCLCLFHDRAFERGLFSLDNNFSVLLNASMESRWATTNLVPYAGCPITLGEVRPSLESLEGHRARFGMRTL